MQLPADFTNNMKSQLGGAYKDFEAALSAPSPISIRRNSLKDYTWKENYDLVKWNKKGVYLKERPIFTLDPAFHAGAYYVQEASSMFIAEAIRQLTKVRSDKPLRVLDLCAAPGGKSTLLLDELPADSFLLCNEVIRNRFQILKYNLIKWGNPSIAASNMDSKQLASLGEFFDLILVDAPCSGEGLFRKTPEATSEWSLDNVALCTARQKRILAEAFQVLNPGGILLYSTCTYNSKENADNMAWAIASDNFQHLTLTLPEDWGIQSSTLGYQFYPHRLDGEGFYLAGLQKLGEPAPVRKFKSRQSTLPSPISRKEREALAVWIKNIEDLFLFKDNKGQIRALPLVHKETFEVLYSKWPFLFYGLELGTFKGKDFVPAPSLALSTVLSEEVTYIELDRRQALAFLRKDPIEGLENLPKGWLLVRYENLGLGWIKSLGNRINNYYPKEWRIRMRKTEGE